MAGCQANSSNCWKNILGWLGWSSSGSPSMLYHGHRVETSPNKMANIMNNFYVKKVADIRAALPPPTGPAARPDGGQHGPRVLPPARALTSLS